MEYYIEGISLKDSTLAFPIIQTLFKVKTPFQEIEVFQSDNNLGKVLLLDGVVQLYERDEFAYHELMTHIPMKSMDVVKKVLVIGGGDGGIIRELVKYYQIQSIDVFEIDKEVVKICKKYFPKISSGFNDKRVCVYYDDATKKIKNVKNDEYDLIIIDGTDPFSIGEGLFGSLFHKELSRVVKSNGTIVGFSGSPYSEYEQHKACIQNYADIYGKENVYQYIGFVPIYTTGCWGFVLISKSHPSHLRNSESIEGLKYYNDSIQHSSFSIPNFAKVNII